MNNLGLIARDYCATDGLVAKEVEVALVCIVNGAEDMGIFVPTLTAEASGG